MKKWKSKLFPVITLAVCLHTLLPAVEGLKAKAAAMTRKTTKRLKTVLRSLLKEW